MASAPRTPLAELVFERMQALGFGRVELARRLGFANATKALRRFDDYLATGVPTSHLMDRLPEVLDIDPAHLADAAETTRRVIAEAAEAKARARFVPHVLTETQAPPGVSRSLVIQAWSWHEKVLGLPEGFSEKNVSRQMRYVARLVRAHYRHYAGELPSWERIVGYRLQRTFDHAVLLRVDGTIKEGFLREPEPAAPSLQPSLQVKGKTVPRDMLGRG